MKLITRTQLLFALFSLLAVGLTGLFAAWDSHRQLDKGAVNYITAISRIKAQEVEEWIGSRSRTLETLAAMPAMSDLVPHLLALLASSGSTTAMGGQHYEQILQYFFPLIERGQFTELFLLEPEKGEVVVSTDQSQVGKSKSRREYLTIGMKKTFIDQVRYSLSVRSPTLVIATPIRDRAGNPVAVLTGRLNLASLSAIMRKATESWKTEDSYLVNTQHYFLTEPLHGQNYMLRKTNNTDGVSLAFSQSKGYAYYQNYRGVEVLGAFNLIPVYDLAILTEIATEEFNQPIYHLTEKIVGMSMAIGLLALAVGWLSTAAILRPLKKLVSALEKVDSNSLVLDFTAKGDHEVTALARVFSQLLERLRQTLVSRDHLTTEVEQRKAAEERLQEALLQVQRSNRELEQFAYVASHDLQEPLRMVASYSQLLADRYRGQLDERADKYINYAVDGALRMQNLIKDLLAFSRVSTAGQEFAVVNLDEVLAEVLKNLQLAISRSDARVLAQPLPTVLGDITQLIQLLQNLLANALKFRGEVSPEIHLRAERRGDYWLIAVQDNGIGIEEKYAEKVFTIFQRLHTREEYEGTGIGLAICKRILERHKGEIWFESKPGEGTTFFFTLLNAGGDSSAHSGGRDEDRRNIAG